MKSILLFIAVLIGIAILVNVNYTAKNIGMMLIREPSYLCVDYEKQNFDDPDSVQLISKHDGYNSSLVTVSYKNRFGGRQTKSIKCYLKNGHFDKDHHSSKSLADSVDAVLSKR